MAQGVSSLSLLIQRVRRTRERLTRTDVDRALLVDKYTGPIVYHYKDGVPLRIVPLNRDDGIDLAKLPLDTPRVPMTG